MANFDIVLAPQQSKQLIVSCRVNETPKEKVRALRFQPSPTLRKMRAYQKRTSKEWLAGSQRSTAVTSH